MLSRDCSNNTTRACIQNAQNLKFLDNHLSLTVLNYTPSRLTLLLANKLCVRDIEPQTSFAIHIFKLINC